ncbi:CinA family protein, partial [Streptococcus suis]
LRLSTKATSQEEANLRLNQLEEDILQHDKLADYFYAYGEDNSLVKTVATRLAEKRQTIAIVEQGTGGLLQAELSLALADQPYFSGGKVVGQLGI